MSAVRFDDVTLLGWATWRASTEVNGATVVVEVEGSADPPARAARAVLWTVEHGLQLRQFCAKRLTDDRNAGWAGQPGEVVGESDFVRLLSLRAIGVGEQGTMQVTYADGGLFRGHTIVVQADEERGPYDVDLGH